MKGWTPDGGPPPFWGERARRLVGMHLLVGITTVDGTDEVLDQRQFHGTVEVADPKRGIAVRRADTRELEWLPADLRAFRPAARGEYRLRSTAEVVVDPDVLAVWTVRRHV